MTLRRRRHCRAVAGLMLGALLLHGPAQALAQPAPQGVRTETCLEAPVRELRSTRSGCGPLQAARGRLLLPQDTSRPCHALPSLPPPASRHVSALQQATAGPARTRLALGRQDTTPATKEDTLRAEQWRGQRREKAEHLQHPEPSFFSQMAARVAGFVERNQIVIDLPAINLYGVQPIFGGLQSGAGTTAGLRYAWFENRLDRYASVEALASLRWYYGAQGAAGYASGAFVSYGYARYWHMPEEDFYGLGPNQPDSLRSTYRLNQTIAGALAGVSLLPNVLVGAHLSYEAHRYGPGQDDDVPTVREQFGDENVPGLGADIDYVQLGGYAEVDTRDLPYRKGYGSRFAPTEERLRGLSLDATRGVYLAGQVVHHLNTGSGRYSFTRLDLEAEEYLPIRHGFQVLALRQHLSLTRSGESNTIPFYMMPTLGGSHTLRGFGSFRFRDRNLALLNTEFRWQVLPILDMALFVDAGHVFHEIEDLSMLDLEVGYGVGFRLRTQERVLARLDVARSREGMTLYFKIGSIL